MYDLGALGKFNGGYYTSITEKYENILNSYWQICAAN
jgi:hypothetical protein